MENFWRLLRTYCLQSTIIGLKYFYVYPDIISRCFWAINMITVLAMSFILTILLYNRFDEMPTRVTIESQFEPVFNLPYPAITLCSPNQITLSSMKYFNRSLVDGNLTIDLETTLPMILGFYEVMSELDEKNLKHLQNVLEANRYTSKTDTVCPNVLIYSMQWVFYEVHTPKFRLLQIPEVMGALPQSCNKFLRRCFLESRLQNCATLFKPILTTHGYCCAFNSLYHFNGKRNMIDPHFINRTIKTVGVFNALSVIIDYDPDDAIAGTLLNAGATRVMFTDWTEFPSDDETSIVDPNGESYHVLRATYTYCSDEVQSLPVWSRKCYFEDEHHLPFFRKYHNSDCDHMCYVHAVQKACGCLLSFLPNLRADAACKITSIPCIVRVKKDMFNWLSSHKCNCPRDCVSRQYRSELIIGNFKAMPYMLRNPNMGVEFNASTSLMHFYFTNPVYSKQKQETVMSITSLISNLGGVFGLFMGCSGISVLEIFFYIYIGIKNYIGYRYRMWRTISLDHYTA